MIRKQLQNHFIGMNKEFQYRGDGQTRIETFSDAVFALAITMLVISTEVPKDFSEMKKFVADIIPFGLCIALMIYIWYEHFLFFIRFGFRNKRIVVLNGCLLFVVLFYVYPLKFLAKLLVIMYSRMFSLLFGWEQSYESGIFSGMIEPKDMPQLMIIYGLGAGLIFMMFVLFYQYAIKKKDELELNALELFDTRSSLYSHIIMLSAPTLSVTIAILFGRYQAGGIISGFIYMLYPVVFPIFGVVRGKKRKLISA